MPSVVIVLAERAAERLRRHRICNPHLLYPQQMQALWNFMNDTHIPSKKKSSRDADLIAFSDWVEEVHYLNWRSKLFGLVVENQYGKYSDISVCLNSGHPVKLADPNNQTGVGWHLAAFTLLLLRWTIIICWRVSKLLNCEAIKCKGGLFVCFLQPYLQHARPVSNHNR